MIDDTENVKSGLVTIGSICPNSTDKKGATKDKEKMENIEYKRLLNFTNVMEHEWDKEQLTFPEIDTKDKYFHELKRIHLFVENKDNVIKFYQTSYVKQSIEKIRH